MRGKNVTYPYINIEFIIDQINENQGRKAIVLLPRVTDDELSCLYRNAIALFYLSDYEGFGLPVLEAMAFKTLAVTVKSSSLEEVGGDAAIYVKQKDSKEVALVMKKIIDQPEWRNNLIKKSKMQVKKFSWQKSAGIYMDNMCMNKIL